MIIENGDGQGRFLARVDKTLRFWTRSVSESRTEEATRVGNGFAITTGPISLTSATESGVLYFKNNDTVPVYIDALTIWRDTVSTVTGDVNAKVMRNPTAGTLISGATSVDIAVNRDTSNPATLVAYKGAQGSTLTGGDQISFLAGTGRFVSTLDVMLRPGQAIGVLLNPFVSTGSAKVSVGITVHKEAI